MIPPDLVNAFKQLYPDCRTERSLQNKWYLARAVGVLMRYAEAHGNSEMFSRIHSPATHYIQTGILTALGRLADDGSMISFALAIQERPRRAGDVVDVLTRYRLGALPFDTAVPA